MSKAIWPRAVMCLGAIVLAAREHLPGTILASALIIAFEIQDAGKEW